MLSPKTLNNVLGVRYGVAVLSIAASARPSACRCAAACCVRPALSSSPSAHGPRAALADIRRQSGLLSLLAKRGRADKGGQKASRGAWDGEEWMMS